MSEDSHNRNQKPNKRNIPSRAIKNRPNNADLEINGSKSPNLINVDFSDFLDVSAHTCASSQTTINGTELVDLSDPDITQDLESELRNDEEPVNFHDSDLGKHTFMSFEGISPVPKINRPKHSNKTNKNQERSNYYKTIDTNANNSNAFDARIKVNNFYGNNQQLVSSTNSELNKQISEERSWYEPIPMADIYTPNESITRIDSEHLKNISSQKSIFQSTPCVRNIYKNKLVKSTPEVQITKEIFNMSIGGESDDSDQNEVTRKSGGFRGSHKTEFDNCLLDCLKISEKVSKQRIEMNLRKKLETTGTLRALNFQEEFKETLLRLVDQGIIQRISGNGMTGSFKLA